MNRTVKEATVGRDRDDDHRLLEKHLTDFIAVYTYARRVTVKR